MSTSTKGLSRKGSSWIYSKRAIQVIQASPIEYGKLYGQYDPRVPQQDIARMIGVVHYENGTVCIEKPIGTKVTRFEYKRKDFIFIRKYYRDMYNGRWIARLSNKLVNDVEKHLKKLARTPRRAKGTKCNSTNQNGLF